jgi:antitoxin component YwqK of YwqJK toxin-antitoxin module
MSRILLLPIALLFVEALCAQPDSLYVEERNGTVAYAVSYPPLEQKESFTHVGRYAMDTSRVAVRLGFKRGKPCGVYRAWYPDGAPMIFAVYGWGYLEGDWTEYAPDGRITVKGKYEHGKRDGTWAFRAQGIMGHYKDGLKDGKWKYYENGRLVRFERYRKGELITGTRSLLK